MTEDPESASPRADVPSSSLSRRRFLTIAGFGAAGAAGALSIPRLVDRGTAPATTMPTAETVPDGRRPEPVVAPTTLSGSDPGLVLVSVQLAGGIDFLNTVVPTSDPRYAAVRGAGSLDGSGDGPELHRLDDAYALSSMPHLADRWQAGELAIVHGVGWEGSSLSHFDATDMWEKGSPDFGTSTGWIGRALTDAAGTDVDPLLALSMGGVSPTMYADGWSAVGLRPGSGIPWSTSFRDQNQALDRALSSLGSSDANDLMSRARASQFDLRDLGARLDPVVGDLDERELEMDVDDDVEAADDGGALGAQLDLVADLIVGGIPTRAFHVMLDGFDTHGNQASDLPMLLGTLDRGIQRFRSRLGTSADRVVVATWSEFGRRPEWNGDGTEHGTAGVQFVVGPRVRGGHHGESPPLDRFDRDDNFLVTTDFRDYLSGVALGTLGADPGRVVDGGRGPIELVEA